MSKEKIADKAAEFCDSLIGTFVQARRVGGEDEADDYWFVPPGEPGAPCVPESIGSSAFGDRIMKFMPELAPIAKELRPFRNAAMRKCRRDGVRATVCDFVHAVGQGLVVHLGRGVAVRVDGSGAHPIAQLYPTPTGVRLLFVDMRGFQPIAWADVAAIWQNGADFGFSGFRHAFLAHMPPDEHALLTADEQAASVLSWWLGVFLAPLVSGRPILALTGVWGSGKSLTGKMLGTAFWGDGYDVSGGISGDRAMKDLASALSERPMVVRDDMNQVPEEITDLLCRVATGARLELAKFHETLAREEYEMRGALAITSIRPRWALREDLLSRLLTLRFGTPPASALAESDRIEIIVRSRTWIWTETLKALCAMFAYGDTHDTMIGKIGTRFQDWERLARRCALAGGWLFPLHTALAKMPEQNVALAARTDPMLGALKALAETPGVADRLYTAAELHDVLMSILGGQIPEDAERRPSSHLMRSPTSLGMMLTRLESIGGSVCIIERAGRSHNAIRWRIRPKIAVKPIEEGA